MARHTALLFVCSLRVRAGCGARIAFERTREVQERIVFSHLVAAGGNCRINMCFEALACNLWPHRGDGFRDGFCDRGNQLLAMLLLDLSDGLLCGVRLSRRQKPRGHGLTFTSRACWRRANQCCV